LVLTQVVLSFGIPFALVPLVILTSRCDVMGRHVNQRRTTIAGSICVAVITALNVLLLCQHF
jgi:manganese transport protein